MKVVFSNGKEGTLSDYASANLFVEDRHTKEAWKELEEEMEKLGIIRFEDPLLRIVGAEMVSIEYVRNQIVTH